MKRIGVLISGNGSNLQSLIDSVEAGEIHADIAVVISNRKAAYGLERARKHGISAEYVSKRDYTSDEDYNTRILDILAEYKVDLLVLAGYLSIISRDVVEAYRNRIVNVHPSLIPAFCGDGFYGERVHRAVLDYGAKVTGATVHFVDEGTDTGPIILQKCVEVMDGDDVDTLSKRVLEVEHELLPKAVKLIVDDKVVIEGRRVKIVD